MYIKAESYSIEPHGQSVAKVMLRVNPLSFKLKAEVELKNGETFQMKSSGSEPQYDFEKRIYEEVMRRLDR